MNVTSRIEGQARPDEILVSTATREKLLQTIFEFGEPRTLSVKGIDDTIVGYPVLGLRDEHV